jgi:hypothetical protein
MRCTSATTSGASSAWEHEARRVICDLCEFRPGDDAPDSENEVFYDDEDDDNDEDMDDVPPSIVNLEVVVPDNYDEDAATAAAMATSLADEDAKWPWLEDIVQLSAMVAAHVPSIPPLPPHAPPQAASDGQQVPPYTL